MKIIRNSLASFNGDFQQELSPRTFRRNLQRKLLTSSFFKNFAAETFKGKFQQILLPELVLDTFKGKFHKILLPELSAELQSETESRTLSRKPSEGNFNRNFKLESSVGTFARKLSRNPSIRCLYQEVEPSIKAFRNFVTNSL